MYPNPQDVLPLPPRPNLEQYKKLAKELVRASQSTHREAIHSWASLWVKNLARLKDRSTTRKTADDPRIHAFAEFAQRKLSKTHSLTDAQWVIARAQGFSSWPKLAKHIAALTSAASEIAQFEAASEAIVAGDASRLRRLLADNPGLVRARSSREHRAALLHYISANGVESYRQRTPKNAVEIARILLKAGAEVDAEAEVYDGRSTTLSLVATSVHPHRAGVQNELIELLLDHGARIELPQGRGDPMVNSCLANGRPEAARFLGNHSARLDLTGAAGIGRLDAVQLFFQENGDLKPGATKQQLAQGFAYACGYGHNEVVEFLLERGVDLSAGTNMGQTGLHWAVMGGHLEIVKLLLARRAPLEVKNGFGGTVLGQALWSLVNDPRPDHPAIIEALIAAGAKVDPKWHTGVSRVDGFLRAAELAQVGQR